MSANVKYAFTEKAWDDYCYWQKQDKKTLSRINDLIKDIVRNGNTGVGKPELLKGMAGCWSRRINEKDRLVYIIEGGRIVILQCRTHYNNL
ncbi:MAG: Txe/YoeB family addiction module toxin [Kiritimatiellaeota bacterium]|nr:Txe/YoeB family addiction module toxin [Kiritimatiellota bacterium]